MMKYRNITTYLSIFMLIYACQLSPKEVEKTSVDTTKRWEIALLEKLPLLGHRNWIVVTDMAYPLQNKPGITTLFADDVYTDVLSSVQRMIDQSPHIVATIYQDKEFLALNNDTSLGIDSLKEELCKTLLSKKIMYKEHEQLISTLDSVSNLFQVVIIKTPLTKPYTSVFFELGCKYWQ